MAFSLMIVVVLLLFFIVFSLVIFIFVLFPVGLKEVFMKNEDFFIALASVDAKFPIYKDVPPSNFFKPHVGPYFCSVYMQLSGCCILYVYKHDVTLFKLFIAPTGRCVICQDIQYCNPEMMQYRPDELKRCVPFLCGKFRTYEHFLKALKRAVWQLDKDFFSD